MPGSQASPLKLECGRSPWLSCATCKTSWASDATHTAQLGRDDVGLTDTMWNLTVDALGAGTISSFGR